MPNYIVNANAQPNGDNEVHVYPQQHSSCSYPAPANQVHLGEFTSGAALLRRRLFRLLSHLQNSWGRGSAQSSDSQG